jgi:glutamyl-tRNA reductase
MLTVVGLNHRTAPVDLRELVSVSAPDAAGTALSARDLTGSDEVIVLSTCNRIEFYFAGGDRHLPAVTGMLAARAGTEVAAAVYVRGGREAASHLFAVAAGLDSMVFGEAQVQGQVRQALELCRQSAGVTLSRLFHAAGHCASRVRTETAVARGAGSVSSAAVQLAVKIFGSLTDRAAMILGAGEVAELALECLASTKESALESWRTERTRARRNSPTRYGARAMHYDECWAELSAVDLVVCSTAAPRTIVYADHVAPAVRRRAGLRCAYSIWRCRATCHPRSDISRTCSCTTSTIFRPRPIPWSNPGGTNFRQRKRSSPPRSERYWQWLAGLEAVPVLTSAG